MSENNRKCCKSAFANAIHLLSQKISGTIHRRLEKVSSMEDYVHLIYPHMANFRFRKGAMYQDNLIH